MIRLFKAALVLFSFFFLEARGQGQADWWYFGANAGLHFSTSGPVGVNDGQLSTQEGCATISDQGGNLLFYTDGITAYDKLHNVMPNGTGLLGNSSSTHSAVIIPRPGNPDDYYIFTVDDGGQDGMHYSRVDMTQNSGNGDVIPTEKNVQLVAFTSEKIAAVKKSNGYWVITHINGTDEYYAYEVTAAGVNTTPVISATGWPTSGFGFGITASSDGEQIAAVYFSTDSIFLYNFDATTGVVTPNLKIGSTMSFGLFYGLEFSPSGNILYMQAYGTGDTRQFDLSSGNSATISASEIIVGTPAGSGGGQLQTGPDGKIYCSRYGQLFLSRINDPDELGAACNWEDTAVALLSQARWGLPTFIQSFFSVGFSAGDHCFGDPYAFTLDTTGIDSVLWNFGDPGSGTSDTSTSLEPTHLFSDTGSFTITLIAHGDTFTDTAVSTIFVYPRQTVDIGPSDTLLCFGDTLELRATNAFSSYLWHDSTVADSILIWEDELVYVTVFGACDTVTDTIQVRFDFPVVLDLGNDTSFCEGNSLLLDANVQVPASFGWNTGDSVETLTVFQSGQFIFTAINGCGTFIDSITIEVIPNPDSALLPPDTLNCFDSPIFLQRPLNDTVTWVWSDSTDVEIFQVDTTMTVWLAAFNDCGFIIDTINIVFNGEIQTELGEDTIICLDDSIKLGTNDPGASFVWNTGDTTDTIWSIPGETENYILTITLRDCQKVESRRVFASDTACPKLDCDLKYGNVFTPNADGINDFFRIESDCDLFKFNMAIYNRWGQLFHFSDNVAYGWDGYVNGELAASGTYYFTVISKDFVVVNADRFVTQGSFTLIR